MQFVENDMDDLFRRAAEEYPLRTDGANWSQVSDKLQAATEENRPAPSANWFALLLLIVPLVVCTTFIRVNHSAPKMDATAATAAKNLPGAGSHVGNNKPPVAPAPVTTTAGLPYEGSSGSLLPTAQAVRRPPAAKLQVPFRIPAVKAGRTPALSVEGSTPGAVAPQAYQPTVAVAPGFIPPIQVAKHSAPGMATLESRLNTRISPADFKSGRQSATPRRRLYAGLMGSADRTSVRQQKVNNLGYGAGLMAGYRLSRRLSVETGVYWARKQYYSAGTHYKANRTYLPQHATIVSVDGFCNMIELPLNLKYDWWQGRRSSWHLLAGVSSYLMQREGYDYQYERYGQQYQYYKEYNRASKNWLGVLNLAVGYEQHLTKSLNLRIEPYYKLPLTGLGIGSLRMTSAGVSVGVLKTIR